MNLPPYDEKKQPSATWNTGAPCQESAGALISDFQPSGLREMRVCYHQVIHFVVCGCVAQTNDGYGMTYNNFFKLIRETGRDAKVVSGVGCERIHEDKTM